MITISQTELKIHNFGENFSVATQTLLTSNGLDDFFSIPGDSRQQNARSGEIVFALGPAIEWGQRPDTGAVVATAYKGTLTIRIRTQRPQDGPSSLVPGILSEHQALAANIISLMDMNISADGSTTLRGPYGSDTLPYYSVKYANLLGAVPYTDWDFLQDVMEMSWDVSFSILPTAWA